VYYGGLSLLTVWVSVVRRQKSIAPGCVHLESKNYREVKVLKGRKVQDTCREGSGFGCLPQHQTLIRASLKGSASSKGPRQGLLPIISIMQATDALE
jgi:hypothetical protein